MHFAVCAFERTSCYVKKRHRPQPPPPLRPRFKSLKLGRFESQGRQNAARLLLLLGSIHDQRCPVAYLGLEYLRKNTVLIGSSETRSSNVLCIVREICYRLCSTCLFQRSPPVLKERAGTAREKSNINNNIRKVQLGNRGGGNTHFGSSLRSMQQAF